MINLIIRLAVEHPDHEEMKKLGGKVTLKCESYNEAFEISLSLLEVRNNERFEYGDRLIFNNKVLIEIE